MPDNGGAEVPEGWFGPTDRIEISATIDERGARKLYALFGDRVCVHNEQDAWLYLLDQYLQEAGPTHHPADRVESDLSRVFQSAIALGLVDASALQAAVDEATR